MAELKVVDNQLELRLSKKEKLESMHGNLTALILDVSSVEILENAHEAADIVGFKVGTRIPGVVEVATVHGSKKKIFAAVHRDTPRGIRVCLTGGDFDEWIVGCQDPEEVISSLNLHER